MKATTELEIAVTTASDYVIPVVVMLKSLFENNKDLHITVNLLHLFSKTKEQDMIFLENYIVQHGHRCRKIGVDDAQLNDFPDGCRQSKDTFLRLLIPDLLPEVCSLLYLDGDIIVCGSLKYFASLSMEDKYIAGAKDTTNFYLSTHCKNLGLPGDVPYFNAGVVYMNLYLMRKEQIIQKFCEYFKNYADVIIANDQDILNGTLWKKVEYFPPKYNMNYMVESDVAREVWGKNDVREAKINPVIIHYIGPVKPWNYLSFHPRTNLWWDYLKMTPFREFYPPPNKSLKNFFKKYYLMAVKTIDYSLPVSFKRKIGKVVPAELKQWIKSKKNVTSIIK
jgi:lipopolysaccharide biosynthesis glycosyltransferase